MCENACISEDLYLLGNFLVLSFVCLANMAQWYHSLLTCKRSLVHILVWSEMTLRISMCMQEKSRGHDESTLALKNPQAESSKVQKYDINGDESPDKKANIEEM